MYGVWFTYNWLIVTTKASLNILVYFIKPLSMYTQDGGIQTNWKVNHALLIRIATGKLVISYADPESFVRGGPTLTIFFNWWGEEGSKYHYKPAIIGPPAKPRFTGVPMMAQTLNAVLVTLWFFRWFGPLLPRNPIFCIFPGGGLDPLSLSPFGSAHVWDKHLVRK